MPASPPTSAAPRASFRCADGGVPKAARHPTGATRRPFAGPATVEIVYRFLRRPKWVALTLAVLLLMVAMTNLGFWQLRRLHDRKAVNAEIRDRTAAAPVPIDGLLGPSATYADGSGAEWRTVTAVGVYDASQEVLVANRSFDGAPGLHVLTPLRLADGRALFVNRGWVPIAGKVGVDVQVPPPPAGEMTTSGRVRATQVRGAIGPRDPTTGRLRTFARADIARIAEQLPYRVVPAYIELVAAPGQDTVRPPRPLPLPALDEGPHLSYALQWFVFTVCAAVGWIAVVRRQLLDQRRAAAALAGAPPAAAPAVEASAAQAE
jgi:surfeit locus 1 family protein